MEKIVITGGAGFIGSHTVKYLLGQNKYIICVDNLDTYYSPVMKRENIAPFRRNKTFRFYGEDVRNIKSLDRIFSKEKPGKIIHLAAKVGVRASIDKPSEYEEVNVKGTLNLLELAKKYKIKQFIFGSSSSVYGNSKKVPFSENDRTDFQISPYGATKKAGELFCRTYSYLYKIPITCLRFFTVYGPGGRPDMAPYKFTKSVYEGSPLVKYGSGDSRRDYTYIDDIVRGIGLSLRKPFDYEIINLGSGDVIDLNNFISLIEKLTGKKAKVGQLPEQKGDVKATYADIAKAKKLLNFKLKFKISEGMKEFIKYYIQTQKHHT